MEAVKQYWVIGALSLAGVGVIVANILVAVLLYSMLKNDEALSCGKEYEDLKTVASIGNATGQMPGGVRIKNGETVSVNPNYCDKK